jgi:hypothetical protein
MLMQLCWPFVGQLRTAQPQTVQVICTVHGVMTVPADQAPVTGKAKPACSLCSAAAVAIGAALAAAPSSESSAGESLDASDYRALQRLHHSPSRPRAPPASA